MPSSKTWSQSQSIQALTPRWSLTGCAPTGIAATGVHAGKRVMLKPGLRIKVGKNAFAKGFHCDKEFIESQDSGCIIFAISKDNKYYKKTNITSKKTYVSSACATRVGLPSPEANNTTTNLHYYERAKKIITAACKTSHVDEWDALSQNVHVFEKVPRLNEAYYLGRHRMIKSKDSMGISDGQLQLQRHDWFGYESPIYDSYSNAGTIANPDVYHRVRNEPFLKGRRPPDFYGKDPGICSELLREMHQVMQSIVNK